MTTSRVWVSSSWELLLDELMRALSAEELDVMEPQIVATPSASFARWVSDRLATATGVSANVRFVGIEEGLGLSVGAWEAPASAARITAACFAELGALAAHPSAEDLRMYLEPDGFPRTLSGRAASFAAALGGELALFEAYRHDLLGSADDPRPFYQRELGQRIHLRLGTKPLATALAESAPKAPASERARAAVHVFACPALASPFARLFAQTTPPSHQRALHAYVWTPSERRAAAVIERAASCPELAVATRGAAEEKLADPAASSSERSARNALVGLVWAGAKPRILRVSSVNDASAAPGNALVSVQRALRGEAGAFSEAAEGGHWGRAGRGDASVRIYASHGPLRQAEVLRDALLSLFAHDATLSPRDVRILTPDLATYAPLVASVFGATSASRAPGYDRSIPLSVAGASGPTQDPAAAALLGALEMAEARFARSRVLDWLALSPVRQRFSLASADLELIERWTDDAAIRWGQDGEDRARALGEVDGSPEGALAADDANTWAYGLERLALAVCSPPEAGLFAGRLPTDDVEGEETLPLGRFFAAVRTLAAHLEVFREPASARQWITRCLAAVGALLADEDPRGLAHLRATIVERLDPGVGDAPASALPKLTSGAVRALLQGSLSDPAEGSRTSFGGADSVILAPLGSAFAVPARVVALLGLDEDCFPSRSNGKSGDALESAPRLLDPEARDADRGAFLQAVLAAGQHLVVVAGLHQASTNAPRPPCAPLSELFEAIDASVACDHGRASELLTTNAPLQPFGEAAFASREGAEPLSSDPLSLAAALALREPRARLPGIFDEGLRPLSARLPAESGAELALEELEAFFRDPPRALLWRRLRARAFSAGARGGDREPIELDALERWKIREELVVRSLAGSAGEARAWLRAAGRLPLGGAGEALLDELQAQLEGLIERYPETLATPRGALSTTTTITLPDEAPIRLEATLRGVTPTALVEISLADPQEPKTLLCCYLRLLVLATASPQVRRAEVLGIRAGKPLRMTLEAPADPLDTLAGYVALHRDGMRGPVSYAPRTSYAFAHEMLKQSPHAFVAATPALLAIALGKARAVWEGSSHARGEREKPAFHAIFRDLPPWEDEVGLAPSAGFVRWSRDVFGPVLAALREGSL